MLPWLCAIRAADPGNFSYLGANLLAKQKIKIRLGLEGHGGFVGTNGIESVDGRSQWSISCWYHDS